MPIAGGYKPSRGGTQYGALAKARSIALRGAFNTGDRKGSLLKGQKSIDRSYTAPKDGDGQRMTKNNSQTQSAHGTYKRTTIPPRSFPDSSISGAAVQNKSSKRASMQRSNTPADGAGKPGKFFNK